MIGTVPQNNFRDKELVLHSSAVLSKTKNCSSYVKEVIVVLDIDVNSSYIITDNQEVKNG